MLAGAQLTACVPPMRGLVELPHRIVSLQELLQILEAPEAILPPKVSPIQGALAEESHRRCGDKGSEGAPLQEEKWNG